MAQNLKYAAGTAVVCILLVCCAAILVKAGVPIQLYENLMQLQELGLYNASDKVLVLTQTNFTSSVLHKNYTSLVEFYNSYCQYCERFAPEYKKLAEELMPWRDVLRVYAIDCAPEVNKGICNEYKVEVYPTLRFFGLEFQPNPKNYGKQLKSQNLDVIGTTLAQWIAAENLLNDTREWPRFQSITEKDIDTSSGYSMKNFLKKLFLYTSVCLLL